MRNCCLFIILLKKINVVIFGSLGGSGVGVGIDGVSGGGLVSGLGLKLGLRLGLWLGMICCEVILCVWRRCASGVVVMFS